jgi:hypothetical protein
MSSFRGIPERSKDRTVGSVVTAAVSPGQRGDRPRTGIDEHGAKAPWGRLMFVGSGRAQRTPRMTIDFSFFERRNARF